MDKNLLLAVTLSLAVYAVWFGLIEKRIAPAGQVSRTGQTAAAPSAQEPMGAAQKQTAPSATPQVVDETAALKQAEPVSFGKARALLSPRGAAVVSWKDQEPLGTVELIQTPAPGFFATFPELAFKRDEKARNPTFSSKRADGLLVTKEFLPEGPDALPRLKLTLANPTGKPLSSGAWTVSIGPGLGTIESEEKENPKMLRAIGLTAPAGGLEGKVEDFKPGQRTAEYRWVGVDNRYFLAAALPAAGDFDRVDSALPAQVMLTAKPADIPPGLSRTWEVPYYLGAKGTNWLSHYHAGLERSVNFGFFAQIGRVVMRVLNRLHETTGNWGWSIIFLTMMIQALLFPLTFKSLKSMAAMRRLQPEISRLQSRYQKDPAKLNAEMMELYKKHGANPLGGCLPMLVQMPIFYALYNALRNAWELHGAPWIFWVKDLSAKDPFYVLPLIMGGVMFVQNKLNAQQTTDPTQQQMMTWMPVIFTFMFLKFPAGLVLYWLTNSLVSTLSQMALRGHFDSAAAQPQRR